MKITLSAKSRTSAGYFLAFIFAAFGTVGLAGCAVIAGSVSTAVVPGYAADSVHSLAIIPFANSWVSPSDSRDLEGKLEKAIRWKHPSITVVLQTTGDELTKKVENCVREYEATGKLDSTVLVEAGKALKVDVIVKCEVVLIRDIPSVFMSRPASCYARVRYLAFGTGEGKLLWQSYADATGRGGKIFSGPGLLSVLIEAQRTAVSGFPL